ncbi:MAG TPA: tryptophanase [Polyangiaceae bacterium]|nr:tryptophanase [Polyangiaceae bacterium]
MEEATNSLEMAALAEPYRIKMVEPIRLLTRAEREQALRDAFYSMTYINSADVFIDLATDSGTGAMSDRQWAAMLTADEAYVRSRSFFRLEKAIREILGYQYVVPTHQGRAAENILAGLLVKPDQIVLSNTHFDTVRAHIEHRHGVALDLIGDSLWDFDDENPFKGNFDLDKLRIALREYGAKVPFISITISNNMACSSPVSMDNIRQVSRLAKEFGIPVLFDASRFAENAYFIKQREAGYEQHSIADIVREMFSYGQGCWMSAKKDAIVNIGGFIALSDESLARRCQEMLVLYEGFPTYGGLAGRDLEAIAVGLEEAIDDAYLRHRTGQVAYLGALFERSGIRCSKPFGGSGVFIDVQKLYPHLAPEQFPDVAMGCDVYREGGVRAAAFPFSLKTVDGTGQIVTREFHFARFAIPRRVYTQSHLDYVGNVMARVAQNAPRNKGYRCTYAPEVLGHFFAKFEPLS